jgi:hypothetical protein
MKFGALTIVIIALGVLGLFFLTAQGRAKVLKFEVNTASAMIGENALRRQLRAHEVQGSFDYVIASLRETITTLRMTNFIWR